MRTDDLICMMAKTPPCSCAKRKAIIWGSVAVLFAALVGIIVFAFGIRSDFARIGEDYGMMFKYAFLAALLAGSGAAWWRSGHPGRCCKMPYYGLIFLGTFLLFNAAHSVYAQGLGSVLPQIFDPAAWNCVATIALFAALGSVVLIKVSKCMAPVNGRLHAFMTGLFASSLGALAYGLHCSHDHPAYLALWYGGTTLAFTLIALPVIKRRQDW